MIDHRVATLFVAAFTILRGELANAQVVHLERDLGSTKGAVSNAAIDGRIRDAAAKLRAYAPVPRIGLYDLAYPKDCTELDAMNGYGIVLITAVAQDSGELPPARAYVRSSRGNTQLSLLAEVQSRVAATDSVVRATFGPFRNDALYFFPVEARLTDSDLLLDFAAHRQQFRIAHLTPQLPQMLRSCIKHSAQAPVDSIAWALAQREYPDLAGTLRPHP